MIQPADLIGRFQHALTQKWGYIWGTAGIRWTQAKQDAATREQTVKYGSRWINHNVADCSGLFAWAFKQLGGTMYHGSNTMYLKWCTDKGRLSRGSRSDGKTLKPGTAVFCYDGATYNHVGLYIGDGTVIEAAGTRSGVITSDVDATKWTHWGELKGVDYSGAAKPAPLPAEGEPLPTLRKGDKGDAVALMQTKLVNLGYSVGASGVDGDFGRNTESAVRRFQQDWGLEQDGICGKKTWGILMSAQVTVRYTVTVPGLDRAAADALKATYPDATVKEERSESE